MKTSLKQVSSWGLDCRYLSHSLSTALYSMIDNRIATQLLRMNNFGYDVDSTRHITISKRTQEMTYTPKSTPTLTKFSERKGEYVWEKKGRQSGKYGKTIRRLLKEQVPRFKFTDSELEELVNRLKAHYSDGEFKIVDGDDIAYHYGRNVPTDTDTLSGSCMQGKGSRYFQIYTANPHRVKLIVLEKDGHLIGRALLWKDKYMDRIYGSNQTIEVFKNFAKVHNYFHKAEQSYNSKRDWVDTTTGESFYETVDIDDLNTDFEYFPYIDTFTYGDECSLSNSDCYSEYTYDHTDGTRQGEGEYDEYNDEYIDADYAVWAWNNCGDEVRTHQDSCHWSDYHNVYIIEEFSVYCESDGDYYHVDDVDDIIIEVDYCYYKQDECFYCEYDERWYAQEHDDYIYIEELSMTVHIDKEEDAYTDNGYHYVEDEWRHEDDLENDGYVLSEHSGEWVLEEE